MLFVFDTLPAFFSSANSNHTYKCPFCQKSFKKPDMMYLHVDAMHSEQIPDGYTAKHYVYDLKHPGEHLCQICKTTKCKWNEKTGRYSSICDKAECREEMRRRFLENYKKKNGKDHSINDPEIQREMLRRKKSSGYYVFRDGGKVFYASSYEKDFLEFCDLSLEISSNFIEECPYSFEYIYEGDKHFYLPDYYIRCYDLIIEIKADDDITHPKILAVDKETEPLKDKAVVKNGTHNFIKICDKKYEPFIELLKILKNNYVDGKTKESDRYIVIPERKTDIRGFEMPKLEFISSEKEFFSNEYTKILFDENKNKDKKIKIQLVIDKEYIPEEYRKDPLFDGNRGYICKEYEIDPTKKENILRAIKEFKNYYTKQCEHFINQNYMSVRMCIFSPWLCLDFRHVNEKAKTQFLEKSLKYISKEFSRYITIKTNLGYQILVDNTKRKDKYLADVIKAVVKTDFFTQEVTITNIDSSNFIIPGTIDGGTETEVLLDYSSLEDDEEEKEN